MEKAALRHIRTSAYCCFLPDLTRFTASHCAGPKPCQAKLSKGNFFGSHVCEHVEYSIILRAGQDTRRAFCRQLTPILRDTRRHETLAPQGAVALRGLRSARCLQRAAQVSRSLPRPANAHTAHAVSCGCPPASHSRMVSSSIIGTPSSCAFLFFPEVLVRSLLIR